MGYISPWGTCRRCREPLSGTDSGICSDCASGRTDLRLRERALDELREQTRLLGAGNDDDGVCECCGQRFVERTRRRPVRGKVWTGVLADHVGRGVCPRCYNTYAGERGCERDWNGHERASVEQQEAAVREQEAAVREQEARRAADERARREAAERLMREREKEDAERARRKAAFEVAWAPVAALFNREIDELEGAKSAEERALISRWSDVLHTHQGRLHSREEGGVLVVFAASLASMVVGALVGQQVGAFLGLIIGVPVGLWLKSVRLSRAKNACERADESLRAAREELGRRYEPQLVKVRAAKSEAEAGMRRLHPL